MFKTKRDAERWIVQMGSSVFNGDFIDPRKGERPFADVIEVWKRRWVNLEPKTRAGYEQAAQPGGSTESHDLRELSSGPAWIRTRDRRIMSPLL